MLLFKVTLLIMGCNYLIHLRWEARPMWFRSPAIAQPFISKSPSTAQQFGEHGRRHPMRPAAAMARVSHLLLLLRCGRIASLQTPLYDSPYNLRFTSAAAARGFCSNGISDLRDRILLLSENPASVATEDKEALRSAVSALADQLLALPDDQDLAALLDSVSFATLLLCFPAGFASVELLSLLKSRPLLALQVLPPRHSLYLLISPFPRIPNHSTILKGCILYRLVGL